MKEEQDIINSAHGFDVDANWLFSTIEHCIKEVQVKQKDEIEKLLLTALEEQKKLEFTNYPAELFRKRIIYYLALLHYAESMKVK